MLKRFFLYITMLLMVFTFAVPSQAELQDMWAYVYKWTGTMNGDGTMKLERLTSGVTFKVLAVDADTSETLYYYNGSTSLTNPVTTTNFEAATVCNDKVAFRVDPTDATYDEYVDLIVVDTNGGFTAFVENFNKEIHSIVIDERPNIVHQGTIWFGVSSAVETDTGVDFLADTIVLDVRTETVTVDAGATLDVGLLSTETSGDADGFIDGRSVAVAGFTADTGIITGGTTIDYVPDSTYGDLLYTIIAGSDAVATVGGRSYLGHIVTGSNACSLTYTGSSGTDTAAGYIHYWFNRIR